MTDVEKGTSPVSDDTQASDSTSSNDRPTLRSQNRLSTVSRHYDLDGKGYLNETEKALRRMDSQNMGVLTMDKVYTIMESLQKEQQSNSELIETLRVEAKRNLKLKKGIIGLCVFTALLAVANIGTSFAAARLAKDTQVNLSTNDLTSVDNSDMRLGTTAKSVAVAMSPLPEHRRRRVLQESQESFFCQNSASSTANCTLVGEINYSDAALMYDNFCPTWSSTGSCSPTGGVSQVILTCNQKQSLVFGAPYLPSELPGKAEDSQAISFPAPYRRYQAQSNSILFGVVLPCIHDYGLGFTCPEPSPIDPNPVCDVFANWEAGQCGGVVDPCGEYDSPAESPASAFGARR